MDRNYCLIVFIVYMSYSDTLKVAKCCLYEKKSMLKKKRKKEKKGINIGSCPQVPVHNTSDCVLIYIILFLIRNEYDNSVLVREDIISKILSFFSLIVCYKI